VQMQMVVYVIAAACEMDAFRGLLESVSMHLRPGLPITKSRCLFRYRRHLHGITHDRQGIYGLSESSDSRSGGQPTRSLQTRGSDFKLQHLSSKRRGVDGRYQSVHVADIEVGHTSGTYSCPLYAGRPGLSGHCVTAQPYFNLAIRGNVPCVRILEQIRTSRQI
jgi:hypothetical protein